MSCSTGFSLQMATDYAGITLTTNRVSEGAGSVTWGWPVLYFISVLFAGNIASRGALLLSGRP